MVKQNKGVEWYYAQAGSKHGPINTTELKRLADIGQLVSSDLVWREGFSKWKKAESIKGLISSTTASTEVSGQMPSSQPRYATRATPKSNTPLELAEDAFEPEDADTNLAPIYQLWPFVCISLLFCFPVGLILVWRNPHWSPGTKWAWSGGLLFVFLLLAMAVPETPKRRSSIRNVNVDLSPQTKQGTSQRRDDVDGALPVPFVDKGSGDPTVDFASLNVESIDYAHGPQGQEVYVVDNPGTLKVKRVYRGKDGKLYEHGENRDDFIDGGRRRTFRSANFVFGRLHGKTEFQIDAPEAIEIIYFKGDRRYELDWANRQKGIKLKESHYLNGKAHGWSSFYNEGGVPYSQVRYEHGEIVERKTFDAESVVPK